VCELPEHPERNLYGISDASFMMFRKINGNMSREAV
jgi:hypothetical protein